jgi:hypothetical protein
MRSVSPQFFIKTHDNDRLTQKKQRSFLLMFALSCYHPPKRGMQKAYENAGKTSDYLFHSTDPTSLFLQTALAKVRTTSRSLARTQVSGTGPWINHQIIRDQFKVYDRALTWLSGHLVLSRTELDTKYPNMITDMLAEDATIRSHPYFSERAWLSGQDRVLPNLMCEYLRHGRLGAVIDEVLHLNNPEATENTSSSLSSSKLATS